MQYRLKVFELNSKVQECFYNQKQPNGAQGCNGVPLNTEALRVASSIQ